MSNSLLEPDRKKVRGRQKGCAKTGGRARGVRNKLTVLLKDAILLGAADAGGKGGLRGYLREQAIANPVAYLQLLGKVLPTQLVAENDTPLVPIVVLRKYSADGPEVPLLPSDWSRRD